MFSHLHSGFVFLNSKKNSPRHLATVLLALLFTASLTWAGETLFSKLVKEFYTPAITDFVNYVSRGERYPLIHAIHQLRFRVFQKKLGINKPKETKSCSDHRNYGKTVPEDNSEFCRRYDELIDLARKKIGLAEVFEPELLREIEKRKARNEVRVWIRQKLNCLEDRFRCGRNERGILERISGFNKEPILTYRRVLQNLEKKLFPEEQVLPPIQDMDLETKCEFVQKGRKHNPAQGMVFIKGGPFKMGSPQELESEKPVREVNVNGFWIDRCEVTNYQYLQFIAKNPFLRKSTFPRKFHDGNYLKNWGDDLLPPMAEELKPVIFISWFAARHFCNAQGKRIPSEAEWEKAARDLSEDEYPFDGGIEFLTDHGWYRGNSGGLIHMAAEKLPNSYGLYDMLGNAWEWVYDRYAPYDPGKTDNPQGPIRGLYRVMRGGGWNDPASYLRPAQRRDALPQSTRLNVGFRCAADFPE